MKLFLLTLIAFALILQVSASSHSEAPGSSKKPGADITDLYAFRSYEAGKTDNLILALGVSGLQNPNAGPNWYAFSDQHFYEFHLVCDATTGDSAHVFQFYFGSRYNGAATPSVTYTTDYDYDLICQGAPGTEVTQRSVALNISGTFVDIPLKVFSTIDGDVPSTYNNINFIETYNLNYFTNVPAGAIPSGGSDISPSAGNSFKVPFTYVGDKSFLTPEKYEKYALSHIATTETFITGQCSSQRGVKIFAGPRQEPFFIDLGRTFDLVNYLPIIVDDQDEDGIFNCPENNDILKNNVNYIVMEVPICAINCPVHKGQNPLHIWAGVRELLHIGANHVPGQQTNRFGNPLINELIIGIGRKNEWNYVHPTQEDNFEVYYKYPTLPAILELLFQVPAPKVPSTGRIDLYTLLGLGIPGLNAYNDSNALFMDTMKINLGISTDTSNTNNLGVIGGDAAGYPNGRRIFDDVVDISLRAVMGVLCGSSFNGGFGCVPADAPVGNVPFGDGSSLEIDDFPSVFPFLHAPNPGSVVNPSPKECSSAASLTIGASFLLIGAALLF